MTPDEFEQKKAEIRRQLEERRRQKGDRPSPSYRPPRYDDVFFEGTAWLDSIARGETEEG